MAAINMSGRCNYSLQEKVSSKGNKYTVISLEFDSGYQTDVMINQDKAYLIQIFEGNNNGGAKK